MKQKTKRQRVTMAEIAQESGLSLSTVSLVLRNKPGISSETRQHVLKIAKKLGYSVRPTCTDRASRIKNLGLIVKSQSNELPGSNSFYSQVLAGIEEACRLRQINLLYAHMPVDENNYPVESPQLLSEDRIDGLLLVGAFVDETLVQFLGQKSLPVVLVDGYSDSNQYDSVVSENYQGAHQAVSYLIQKGHSHIGLVGSHPHAYPSLLDRRKGYLQALHDHNLNDSYFADSTGREKEHVISQVTDLLHRHSHLTALFACNDKMAMLAIHAAHQLGYRVPDDLSVIGFDDVPLAEHVIPALTTMRVDKINMGQLAVLLLAKRIEQPNANPVTTVIHPILVERHSVRRIPRVFS